MLFNRISRRDTLRLGTFATGSLLVGAERATAMSVDPSFGVARRCVLVWLDGGPSHLETFDPKPNASSEVRGPLGVLRTRTPGEFFSESLPSLAACSNQFSVIRSMSSPIGEHNLATSYALSGHIPGGRATAPAFMLPAAESLASAGPLPKHVAVPNFGLGGGSRLQGYLSAEALPWSLELDATAPAFLDKLLQRGNSPEMKRLQRRRDLLAPESVLSGAIDLLTDVQVQRAFDVSQESAQTRQRYGGKAIGQNCLLARRMLESGVPLVTVNNKGWDTHDSLKARLYSGYVGAKVPVGLAPAMDQAVAALLADLQSSGLLADTLVVVMGEFGRTPKINSRGGRDHWPRAYSVLLAGAGIRSGMIYGSSDPVGENAERDPVGPADLVATLYHLLGFQPHDRLETPDGQSLSRVPEAARVVRGVLS